MTQTEFNSRMRLSLEMRKLSIGERLTVLVYLESYKGRQDIQRQLAEYEGIMPDEVRQALVVRLGDAQARCREIGQSLITMGLMPFVQTLIAPNE